MNKAGDLPAFLKSRDKQHRQAGPYHFILGRIDIVRDTVKPEDTALAIVDSIAGPRVAVPRLTHSARVDNHPMGSQHQPDTGRQRH